MSWVSEGTTQVVFGFIDASGARANMSVYMDAGEVDPLAGGPLALGNALQAISNDFLSITECRVRATQTAPGTPTDGPYARGADKLKLVFRGVDGSPINFQIGSPSELVLDDNKQDVDRANAAIIALEAAMVLYGKTAEGKAVQALQLGYRHRPSRRKGL